MIALVAILSIKPGTEEQAVSACRKMTEAVHKHEKECLLYEPYMPTDGSLKIYFLEKYTGMEALEAHRQSEHYKEFRAAVTGIFAEAPEVTLLNPLE